MPELVSKRTKTNKTFDNGNGTRTNVATLTALHYESVIDSGVYDSEVDCTPVYVDNAQLDGWLVTQNEWHYALGHPIDKLTDGWVGFGGRQGQDWFKFRLARVGYLHWSTRDWQDIGGAPDYDRANLSNDTQATEVHPGTSLSLSSVATWSDIWTTPGGGSLSARWRVSGDELKEEIIVNQIGREWIKNNAPPTTPVSETWFGFIFQADWSEITTVIKDGIPQDVEGDFSANGDGLELLDAESRLLAFMPVDEVHVDTGSGRESEPLQKRFWKDGDNYYLLVGVRCDRLAALPAGDLVFDPTVTPQIAANADDCITYGAAFDLSPSGLFLGNDGISNDFGMRFTLDVPSGATVTASKLTYEANATLSNDTVRLKYYYHDADDPGDFSADNAASFAARTRSGVSVDDDFTTDFTSGSSYDSASLVTLAQALIDEAYWDSGDHCVIIGEDDGSDGGAYRRVDSFFNDPSGAAIFTVEYILPTPPTPAPTEAGTDEGYSGIPSRFQSLALPILVSDALWLSDRRGYIETLTNRVSNYQHDITNTTGYDSATFQIQLSQTDAEDWVMIGLGRHIVVKDEALVTVWEGFVNKVQYKVGTTTISVGPLLDTKNEVAVTYSTIDTTTDPPTLGVRATTAYTDDAASQAKYAIFQEIISQGGSTAALAEQIRDKFLREYKDPPRSSDDNFSQTSSPVIRVDCLGYYYFLDAYIYTNTGVTGTENLSTKIQNILGDDPNGIFSTDYTGIEENTVQVTQYENDGTRAKTIIEDLVSVGDVSDNVYNFMVLSGRKVYYFAAPATVDYIMRISERTRLLEDRVGNRIRPWAALPGKWRKTPDLFVGRSGPSDIRTDFRCSFITKTTFIAPDNLRLTGNELEELPQLLAKVNAGSQL